MEPITSSQIYSRSTLVEVLDDLCVKFILNLPEEELQSIERLSFQIEAAQWYFEDFIREINPSLPTLNLRTFLSKIFAVCPLPLIAGLPPDGAENAFLHFMAYKTRVPVRGAIILNPTMDKCLLVKGWKKGASWSFPRGKINKDEDDLVCAIREVQEETGFDCQGFARNEDFVEMTMRDQNLKLFIVPGIPEDTVFECQTRKEISDIKWHKLSDLPTYNKQKKQQQQQQQQQSTPTPTGKYYMVLPFLKDLRKWISTTGKKWLQDQHQQKLSAAANLIADETEVEEEITSPPTIDQSIESRNIYSQQPAAANGYASTDEANARLRNMLQFGAPTEQQGAVDESSARLMNMLFLGGTTNSGVSLGASLGGSPASNQNPNINRLDPNPRALLSMLQAGDTSTALNYGQDASRGAAFQAPSRAPQPQHQTFSARQPQSQQQQMPKSISNAPQPADTPHQIQQQQGNFLKPPRNTGGIGSGAGWPQFPRNVPEHHPSPPPASSFPAPPQMQPLHPQYNHTATPPPAVLQNPICPPQAQQPPLNLVDQNGYKQYPQKVVQPSPAQLNAFVPPPAPSKPPDPNQAGTLLSILKGATPAPQNIHAPPPAPPTPTHNFTVPTPVPTSVPAPPPSNPQRSPTPKGPRAQQTQSNKGALLAALHGNTNGSPRASTVVQSQNAFAPPPTQPTFNPTSHPSTTQPQFRASPGMPGGQNSQYGPPKTKTPVQGLAFDRRESVSNEQQQTLLAMFRTGTPTAQGSDEAVMSSPEQSPAKLRPTRVRSLSGNAAKRGGGGGKAEILRSPLGKKSDGFLMAYLEDVAKGGGH